MRFEGGQAASCTCLSAASYCASFPRYSAHCFGVLLHARAVRRPAVRRSAVLPDAVLDGHGAAQEQFFDRFGIAIVRCIVQRRPPVCIRVRGRTPADAKRKGLYKGPPAVVLGVDVGVGADEDSDDSAIAVERRPVQRGPSIPVRVLFWEPSTAKGTPRGLDILPHPARRSRVRQTCET